MCIQTILRAATVSMLFSLGSILMTLKLYSYSKNIDSSKPFALSADVLISENKELIDGHDSFEKESQIRRNMKRILRRRPLSAEVFHHAGLISSSKSEIDEAQNLFYAAQERNPRSSQTALQLLNTLLFLEDYEAALDELDLLYRLVPSKQAMFTPILNQLTFVPETFVLIQNKFNASPKWRTNYMKSLLEEPVYHSYASKLVRQAIVAGQYDELIQKSLVKLVEASLEQGDIDSAILLWQNSPVYSEEDMLKDFEVGRVLKSVYPSPFGWTTIRSHYGKVVLNESGQLVVTYNGEKRARLLSRIFLLNPGQRYSLRTTLVKSDATAIGQFTWSLNCIEDVKNIVKFPISSFDDEGAVKASFEVPLNQCDAQKLTMIGDTNEKNQMSHLVIKEVHLAQAP